MNLRDSKSSIIDMKRTSAALLTGLLIVIMLIGGTIGAYAQSQTMTAVGNPNAKSPSIKARAGLLYSVDLEETFFSKNPDKKCDPYSITKLVSAVVAAENADMDKTVTVSAAAADDIANGTTMYLEPGEKVTLEELMYGALLESGNDAAYALAEGTSGSVNKFVKLMNQTVTEWGCKNTHFTNPMGLQNKDHYTTCNDLLIIMKHAMANETVRKVMTTKKYKMAATNKSAKRLMKSHVTLIQDRGSGVLGGKTGFWETTDCSVSLLYSKRQLTAIMILLKDTEKGRDKDAENLLKFAHKVIPGFRVARKGDPVASVWVKHGERTHVSAEIAGTVYAYPKDKTEAGVTVEFIPEKGLEAPLEKGTKVGTYKVTANGGTVATRDVLLSHKVNTGWITSYLYISNRAAMILGPSLAAMFILILLLVKRHRNKNSYEAKH